MGSRSAKAKAKAAPPALDGCVVAFSGRFEGLSHAVLKSNVEALGGKTATSITSTTTHLVASQNDYNSQSNRVETAQKQGIYILNAEWILECEKQGARAAEDDYDLSRQDDEGAEEEEEDVKPKDLSPPARPTKDVKGTNGVTANSRKRTRSSSIPRDSDSQTKKSGKAKGPSPKKPKPEPAFGEGQVAKRKDIQIPLDESCPFSTSTVYIDDDGVIYDASLNQTNAGANANKFYRIQLLRDPNGTYRTWTRWGRVGDHGQTAVAAEGDLLTAKAQFEKKFKDKSGLPWSQRGDTPKPKKYVFVERNYSEESDEDEEEEDTKEKGANKWTPPECKLEPEVRNLMQLIFNQNYFAAAMSALNYDASKLPLGKLSEATITRGFQALKDLSALIDDHTLAANNYQMTYEEAVESLSNTFYSLIPHNFGRNRPPVIRDQAMVKTEIELLESLSDMKDAELIMKVEKVDSSVHVLDRHFAGLNLEEMTPLNSTSQEFAQLKDYLMVTRGATHDLNYKLESIFRIERQGEKGRFDDTFGKKAKNRRLLWHGSRVTNFGGILSQGLRIAPPEAPATGYMFDKGIYLADMSSKSANYCYSHYSGGTALLLLCEAELGDPMQNLVHADYNAGSKAKKKGLLATWGQGMTGPSKWKDASCVHPSLKGVKMPDTTVAPGDTGVQNASLYYNEYICYDVAQVRLRYLFRVKM